MAVFGWCQEKSSLFQGGKKSVQNKESMSIENQIVPAVIHLRSTPSGHVIIDGVIPKEAAIKLFGENVVVECIISVSALILSQKGEVENNSKLGAHSVSIHPHFLV